LGGTQTAGRPLKENFGEKCFRSGGKTADTKVGTIHLRSELEGKKEGKKKKEGASLTLGEDISSSGGGKSLREKRWEGQGEANPIEGRPEGKEEGLERDGGDSPVSSHPP